MAAGFPAGPSGNSVETLRKFNRYSTRMPAPDPTDVEIVRQQGFVEARYLGEYSFEGYKKRMEISVRSCLEHKQTLLLVDITGLSRYLPTVSERHKIGVYGAELSRGLKKVAALGTFEQIGPEPFSSMVARNRGLRIRAFVDRAQAVAWLTDPDA